MIWLNFKKMEKSERIINKAIERFKKLEYKELDWRSFYTGYLEAQSEQLALSRVSNWVAVEDGLPKELETVWISNGKGWTTLGCIVYAENGWHWAETNGVIYQKKGRIVSECESDDLDVKFWYRLPEPPFLL